MKKVLCWMLLCLLCLTPVLGLADGYFPWLAQGVTLRLDWADEVDAQAQGWTPDEGFRFVQLHFTIMEGPQPTEEVNANVETLLLRASPEKYTASVIQMPGVQFDAETGTFSTDETQEAFDLFYMVPEKMALHSMALQAPHEDEGAFFTINLEEIPGRPEEEAK